jgi:hypothetical protein
MIGSNIFITNKLIQGSKILSLIKAFKKRVLADGGTFEAESCLEATLKELNKN